jgi:hypothetical protein
MTTGQALGIAVVSRALFILADVSSAGAAALSGTRRLRAAPAGGPGNGPDELPLAAEAVSPSRR